MDGVQKKVETDSSRSRPFENHNCGAAATDVAVGASNKVIIAPFTSITLHFNIYCIVATTEVVP